MFVETIISRVQKKRQNAYAFCLLKVVMCFSYFTENDPSPIEKPSEYNWITYFPFGNGVARS